MEYFRECRLAPKRGYNSRTKLISTETFRGKALIDITSKPVDIGPECNCSRVSRTSTLDISAPKSFANLSPWYSKKRKSDRHHTAIKVKKKD